MKTRHIIILPLVAAVALSCTRESADKGDGQTTGIGFVTRFDETRGTMLGNAGGLAAAGGFEVWAIGHPDSWASAPTANKIPVMDDITVTSSDGGSTWSYGTATNWPMDRYVSFFAYGPAASATVIAATPDGTPAISFEVASTVQNHTDLVIATPVKDQAGAAYSYGKPVGISFRHALARISFSGLLVDAADTRVIKVKKIVLNNLYAIGTTPLTDPAEWTPRAGATASYTVSAENSQLDGTVTLDNTGPMLTTAGGYLFLVPQPLARGLGEDPTMDVTLEIDGEEVSYSSLVFSPESWEPGKSYNYQIAVGLNDLRIIYIDSATTLDPWGGAITLQTVPLSSEETPDHNNIGYALSVLNSVNTGTGGEHYYPYFGIYGVNDINHDINIDVGALELDNFVEGQFLLFDFKKSVRVWGNNGANQPWKVTVLHTPYWDLQPSQQNLLPDAISGATLPVGEVKNYMTARGSIILKRNNTPYPTNP